MWHLQPAAGHFNLHGTIALMSALFVELPHPLFCSYSPNLGVAVIETVVRDASPSNPICHLFGVCKEGKRLYECSTQNE
jgi:hypothetical protein